jgi:hypothetical protein
MHGKTTTPLTSCWHAKMLKRHCLLFFIVCISVVSVSESALPSLVRRPSQLGRHGKTNACMRLRGGGGITLKTVTSPDKALALTNKIYVHASDLRRIIPEGATEGYVTTRGCTFMADSCDGISAGSVALNSCQRRSLQISCDEDLTLEKLETATSTLHVRVCLLFLFFSTRNMLGACDWFSPAFRVHGIHLCVYYMV